MIHIQTALTMIALSHFACGTAMALIWYKNRKINGIAEWTLSRLFLVVSYTLYASRGLLDLPLLPSVLLSNGLLFIGLYLMWLGNAKFMQTVPRYSTLLFSLIFSLTLGLLAYYTQVENSYQIRVVISSFWVALWAIFCIGALKSKTHKANYLTAKALIVPYCLLATYHLMRVGYYIQGDVGDSFLNAGIVTGITIMSDIVLLMFTAIATMALVVEDLQTDLQHKANHDALTNAYNRRAFYTKAEKLVATARRDKIAVSLLTIDLDHFKKVNDEFGHMVGDKVLVNFVQLIKSKLRNPDLLARFGGEEFIVFLFDADQDVAYQFAENVRAETEASKLSEELDVGYITCSIGFVSLDRIGSDFHVSQLIDSSDKFLYSAKISGRNQVSYC